MAFPDIPPKCPYCRRYFKTGECHGLSCGALDGEKLPSSADLLTALAVISRWQTDTAVRGGIHLVRDLVDALELGVDQAALELRNKRRDGWEKIEGGGETR